ncbi:MAG: TIGR03619 family F420-dependent LLM class oxidoreductase [Chloroflexi bacterium]|nr:TIGR03619 family F420-dependent LLM class oxidoreductase [Chloroflexota bacterium]
MKFGLFGLHRGANADPDVLARRARLAEDAGFESLWLGDHIMLPFGAQALPTLPADQPRLEVVVALGYLAAVTSRVRLGLGVIVLPQRQPVLLAKQLTTVDVLSRGRLIFGIGVGYLEPELESLGASLADRGARTDEYLAAIRAIWAADAPDVDGRYVRFASVMQRPLPVQRPHPPIVVGGSSRPAYRRAILAANGFYGSNYTVAQSESVLREIRALAASLDRPPALGDLEITVTPTEPMTLDLARQYAALGVDRLLLQPRDLDGPEVEALIAMVGETLVGRA